MKKLLLIPLFAILLIFTVSFVPVDALKSQGTSSSRIGVDICGDRLCEAGEKMTPQEKLGYYLLSLLEFEIDDDTVLQQSRFMMMGVGGSGGMFQQGLDSSISRGQFSYQYIPTMSALASSPPSFNPDPPPRESSPSINPGEAKFFNPQPEPPKFSAAPPSVDMNNIPPTFGIPKTFTMTDYSPMVSKKFDSSARSIASLIDKTKILQGKIDFSKVNPIKRLQPINSAFPPDPVLPTPSRELGIASPIDKSITFTGVVDCSLRGNGVDLSGCDLSLTNLSYERLQYADLSFADLSGATISNTHLNYATLNHANLSDSDLRGSSLQNANLIGANLSNANLSDANLDGANLLGAILSDDNLDGTNMDCFNHELCTGSPPMDPTLRYSGTSGNVADSLDMQIKSGNINLTPADPIVHDWKFNVNYSDTINIGEEIIWNFSGGAHNLVWDPALAVSYDPDSTPTNPPLPDPLFGTQLYPYQTGGLYKFTFTEPGTYYYYCTPHGSSMEGVVTVLMPIPPEQPPTGTATSSFGMIEKTTPLDKSMTDLAVSTKSSSTSSSKSSSSDTGSTASASIGIPSNLSPKEQFELRVAIPIELVASATDCSVRGPQAFLAGCDLSGADLSGANLH